MRIQLTMSGSCHCNSVQVSDFDYVLYPGLRRGICADDPQGWGSRGQLRPPLLHSGCQSGLQSSSWNLHHINVHLWAWLPGRLHPQPGSQNTQVSPTPVVRFWSKCYYTGSSSSFRYHYYITVQSNNGCVSLSGRWWRVKRDWGEPFRRFVWYSADNDKINGKQFWKLINCLSHIWSKNATHLLLPASQITRFATFVCFISLYIEYLWVLDCWQNKQFEGVTFGSGESWSTFFTIFWVNVLINQNNYLQWKNL